MNTFLTMPQRIYFALTESKQVEGPFFAGDMSEDLDVVLDDALPGPSGDCPPFRIFCIEFDPDTNMPERTTDVTEDAIRNRNEWLVSQGRSPISSHPDSEYYDAA